MLINLVFAAVSTAVMISSAQAQQAPDLPHGDAACRAALSKLAIFDGIWVGHVTFGEPGTAPRTFRHSERVGPMLNDTVRVLEGHTFGADGTDVGPDALGVVRYDEAKQAYAFTIFRSAYSGARTRTGEMLAPGDGFIWWYVDGAATYRYVATVRNGIWHEDGWLIREGQPSRRIVELDLKRTGSTDWPNAGIPQP